MAADQIPGRFVLGFWVEWSLRPNLYHALCAAALISAVLWSAMRPASAMTSEVVLSCPTEVPSAGALCAALRAALHEQMPQLRIRDVDQSTAPTPEDVTTLRLVLDKIAQDHLSGHLELDRADASLYRGAIVELAVMDALLTPRLYQKFARSLVLLSPELTVILTQNP